MSRKERLEAENQKLKEAERARHKEMNDNQRLADQYQKSLRKINEKLNSNNFVSVRCKNLSFQNKLV